MVKILFRLNFLWIKFFEGDVFLYFSIKLVFGVDRVLNKFLVEGVRLVLIVFSGKVVICLVNLMCLFFIILVSMLFIWLFFVG